MLQNLKAVIDQKGFNVVQTDYTAGTVLLNSKELFKIDKVKLLRGSGIYECKRRCEEVIREVFEGDKIEWMDSNTLKFRRGIVRWYEEKGYFGVAVEGCDDILLLAQCERPEIIERAFKEE